MLPEVIIFLAILILIVFGSFLLMWRSKNGIKAYFAVFGFLLIINLLHLSYVLNLPPASGFENLGEVALYVWAMMIEEFVLLVFSSNGAPNLLSRTPVPIHLLKLV